MLIHAQRPRAVACAELEVWNEKFGRWVNKGAHGIALIRDKGGRAALTHVFDVRDTHHRDELPFRLWETRSEMRRDIAEALENSFGHLPMKATIGDAAISACKNICEDNLTDYLDNIMSSADGSLLDDYDEDNMRVRLLPLLKYSKEFWTTWFPHENHEKNDEVFREIFDRVINLCREKGNPLFGRGDMRTYCREHPECRLDTGYSPTWGFRVPTQEYMLYLRCCPDVVGDYNFYVYAYRQTV